MHIIEVGLEKLKELIKCCTLIKYLTLYNGYNPNLLYPVIFLS